MEQIKEIKNKFQFQEKTSCLSLQKNFLRKKFKNFS